MTTLAQPRRARLSAFAFFRLLVGSAIALCVPVFILYFEYADQTEKRNLLDHGRHVTAIVTKMTLQGATTRIDYTYTVDGVLFNASANKQLDEIPQVEIGSPVHIKCLPADPQVNWFGGGLTAQKLMTDWRNAIVVSAAVFFVFGLFTIQNAWHLRRRLTLARQGASADGIVDRSDHAGFLRLRIEYHFTEPTGQSVSGRTVLRSSVAESLSPGTVVQVYFNPNQPSNSEIAQAMRGIRIG